MFKTIATIAVLFACVHTLEAVSIGSKLSIGYSSFKNFPTTVAAARASGWVPSNDGCVEYLGISFTYKSNTASRSHPHTLYFTGDGSISGIGILMFGAAPQKLVSHGFWVPVKSGVYRADVAFRQTSCSPSNTAMSGLLAGNSMGDRLVLNPSHANFTIPTTAEEAAARGFSRGSCIAEMGTHWSFDIETAPVMSWKSENLVPVMPMYDPVQGNVLAFLFAAPERQQTIIPPSTNNWDTLPLLSWLMCKNWCPKYQSKSCDWDNSIWSTSHTFLSENPKAVQCPGGCSIQCCDN